MMRHSFHCCSCCCFGKLLQLLLLHSQGPLAGMKTSNKQPLACFVVAAPCCCCAQEYTFCSGSADNIKKWKLPAGEFLHNMLAQQRTIVNAMCVNEDGVMATGGDNGSMWLWDWKSGHCFQQVRCNPACTRVHVNVCMRA